MRNILRYCIYFLPCIAVSLVIAQIVVANHLASSGEQLLAVDTKIGQLAEENQLLAQQYASASSYLTVSARAVELGFAEPEQFLTVGPDQFSVAFGNVR